jgi:hypothetical protein
MKTFILVHQYSFGGGVWGICLGSDVPQTRHEQNTRSGAVWEKLWGTPVEMLYDRPEPQRATLAVPGVRVDVVTACSQAQKLPVPETHHHPSPVRARARAVTVLRSNPTQTRTQSPSLPLPHATPTILYLYARPRRSIPSSLSSRFRSELAAADYAMASKRILKELKDLQRDPPTSCSAGNSTDCPLDLLIYCCYLVSY